MLDNVCCCFFIYKSKDMIYFNDVGELYDFLVRYYGDM